MNYFSKENCESDIEYFQLCTGGIYYRIVTEMDRLFKSGAWSEEDGVSVLIRVAMENIAETYHCDKSVLNNLRKF